MLVVVGAFLFVIVLFIFAFVAESLGVVIVASLAFGMLFSIHQRTKAMHDDMQLIKEKLGAFSEKDIEKLELKRSLAWAETDDHVALQARNQQIEEELQQELRTRKDD